MHTQSQSNAFCTNCHVGSLQLGRATYARWHAEQFVMMPDVPAWRCDLCGAVFYDDKTLTQLLMLLGPESDMENQRRWPSPGLESSREPDLGDLSRV